MAATGLDVFDKTLQTTNIWLDEIMARTGPERHLAWHALGAVLRAVRDRLPAELSAHLSAQLPLLVRGAYYDQWRPAEQPERYRNLDAFLGRIGAELQRSRPVDVQDVTRTVLRVLTHHLNPGVIGKVGMPCRRRCGRSGAARPRSAARRRRPMRHRRPAPRDAAAAGDAVL